ncbi:MAG: SNF2-related protein [Verrucomicrobiota bacterium]
MDSCFGIEGYKREETMILEGMMPYFDYGVCRRGAGYARSGKIVSLRKDQNGLHAKVQGMRTYDVDIRLGGEPGKVSWSCTCPYFEDVGPCKHIWACLIEAEEFLEDIYLGNDVSLEMETVSEPEKGYDWREAIRHVKAHTIERPAGSVLSAGEVIHYLIDIEQLLSNTEVYVSVLTTRPLKNEKGWTKYKPLKIGCADIMRLPDEADRRILPILRGNSRNMGYWGAYSVASDYSLSIDALSMVLGDMAGTGRLVARDRFGKTQFLALEEGVVWKFALDVHREPGSSEYVIEGYLRKDGEEIPLLEPDVLLITGWMILKGRLVRYEHGGNFHWIAQLRKNSRITVPEKDTAVWLPEFLECERPRTRFPEELSVTEQTGKPTPRLNVHADERVYSPDTVQVSLSYRYGNEAVQSNDPRKGFFDNENRVLVRRDLSSEKKCLEKLNDLPVRLKRYPGRDHNTSVPGEIRKADLGGIVHSLLDMGWEVYAQGKPYRRASSFQINVCSGTDWFGLNGGVEFDGKEIPMPQILKSVRAGERMLKLGDGSVGILPEEWLNQLELIAGTGEISKKEVRFGKSQVFLLDALLAGRQEVAWDETSDKLRKELRQFSGAQPINEPEGFRGELRQYQREGMGWFNFLDRFGFGGCLADDMGLGKTVQVLALLEARRKSGKGPSLVVAPSSVVANWVAEANRFVPALSAIDHTGIKRSKTESELGSADLFVTSYATLRRDIVWLRNIDFDYVILDEAQAIKNANTATAKAARLIKGEHRLALSGTPIENHLGELWSLFEFLNPGMLGRGTAFERALSKGGLDLEDDMQNLICKAIRPFIMRRTKEQVAKELPEKHEETVFCELPTTQRKKYDELREYYRQQLSRKIETNGLKKSKIIVLEALLRLRQMACHPGLIDSRNGAKSSGKMDLLMEQIEDIIAEGHKALVFSQFTKMLGLVRRRLDARKITYEYLDGRTRNRAEHVNRFQTDPSCPLFLISLKAGGTGLNLTAADYVILLDPWWNPAVETQAIDRTHRIGQTRKVFAYRLVAKDTVEERILELQARKRKLAESIIKADSNLLRSLSREDLEMLLS